jgi:hypothetical protein
MVCLNITCSDNGDDLHNTLLQHSDIEVIQEKGFNGEKLLEVFISSIPAIAIVASIIIERIKTKKISKIVLDGDKLELEGVSEELIKDILSKKYVGEK